MLVWMCAQEKAVDPNWKAWQDSGSAPRVRLPTTTCMLAFVKCVASPGEGLVADCLAVHLYYLRRSALPQLPCMRVATCRICVQYHDC